MFDAAIKPSFSIPLIRPLRRAPPLVSDASLCILLHDRPTACYCLGESSLSDQQDGDEEVRSAIRGHVSQGSVQGHPPQAQGQGRADRRRHD